MNICKSYISRLVNLIQTPFQSQNAQQKYTICCGFVFDSIGIIIGNCSALFIPTTYKISPDIIYNSQFLNLQLQFNILLIINLITTICFAYLYFYELKREFWLVNTFDYSKRYDSLHLKTYKTQYPELFTTLNKINIKYHIAYTVVKWVFVINFVSSIVIIGVNSYDDYKTATTLFTNLWFCWTKIKNGLTIARESIKNNIGYSYYNVQNLSFNRIDSHVKRHVSTSNIVNLHTSFNGIGGIGDIRVDNSRINSQYNSQSNSQLNSQSNSLTDSLNEYQIKNNINIIEMEPELMTETTIL